jgi:hypothetical protein
MSSSSDSSQMSLTRTATPAMSAVIDKQSNGKGTLTPINDCGIQLSHSIGKQLRLLPDVILTCIWHFFNLEGIVVSERNEFTYPNIVVCG